MEKLSIDVDNFKLVDTPVKDIVPKMERVRNHFYTHKTKDLNYRIGQLKVLRSSFVKYRKEINRTNYLDLGQSDFFSDLCSDAMILSDIDYIISNVTKWAQPTVVDTPLLLAPATSYLVPEPMGVCTVFSAWNSQYLTLIQPIAAAIAAGNCVIAKPSEMAPFSAKLIEYILADMDQDLIQIIQGGADQCIELTRIKSDIILFTGSPMKGKLVSKAAAEHLTPVILELGGQNPVIVDATADLKCTAYNLIAGRYIIAGQACIAPEYVMVERPIYEKLIELLKTTVEEFYTKDPKTSNDFHRIINEWHTDRLQKLLETHNGKVVCGGDVKNCSIKDKYVPPSIISFDSMSEMAKSSLAKDEIFGPILYLCPYDKLDECINYINGREKPLAMYYFGFDKKTKKEITLKTSSGALMFNDTVFHFASHYLPFGGVGNSGTLAYHGKSGFDNLSHLKPICDRTSTVIPFKYPPFTSTKKSIMGKIVSISSITQYQVVKSLVIAGLLVAVYLLRNNIYGGFNGFINPKF